MANFKFICHICGFEFIRGSKDFSVSYGNVLETKCPSCGGDTNNLNEKISR